MYVFSLNEAKANLSKLVRSAANGNEIWIAIEGKPVAKLVAYPKKSKRRFGVMKGKVKISKDFDAPLPREVFDEKVTG